MDLLRKKDLHPAVGVAKSTVADWVEDFSVYIPKIKKNNVTYYRPEAIDVLRFIKHYREDNYQKQQIMEALSANGFPVTVDEQKRDTENSVSPRDDSYNSELLSVVQTMGQAFQQLSDQDESVKDLRNKSEAHEGRMDEVEKRTDKNNKTIDDLRKEIEELKKELAATKEDKKRQGFWSRLFYGNKESD